MIDQMIKNNQQTIEQNQRMMDQMNKNNQQTIEQNQQLIDQMNKNNQQNKGIDRISCRSFLKNCLEVMKKRK
jgi:hypothetical protein